MRLLSVWVIAFIFSSCIHKDVDLSETVQVILHRGYHLAERENTQESFNSAHKQGYDHIEFDICFTRDFVPVILHDLQMDGQSDTTGLIGDLAVSDLDSIRLNGGYSIPVLDEALRKMDGYFKTIFIDLKAPCPDSGLRNFISIIRKRNLFATTVTTSADLEVVRKLQTWEPRLLLGTDGTENGFENNLAEAMKQNYGVVLVILSQLDKHLISIAHANHIKIYAYTADTELEMEEALRYDIDGIMTDNPDLIRRILE